MLLITHAAVPVLIYKAIYGKKYDDQPNSLKIMKYLGMGFFGILPDILARESYHDVAPKVIEPFWYLSHSFLTIFIALVFMGYFLFNKRDIERPAIVFIWMSYVIHLLIDLATDSICFFYPFSMKTFGTGLSNFGSFAIFVDLVALVWLISTFSSHGRKKKTEAPVSEESEAS